MRRNPANQWKSMTYTPVVGIVLSKKKSIMIINIIQYSVDNVVLLTVGNIQPVKIGICSNYSTSYYNLNKLYLMINN